MQCKVKLSMITKHLEWFPEIHIKSSESLKLRFYYFENHEIVTFSGGFQLIKEEPSLKVLKQIFFKIDVQI